MSVNAMLFTLCGWRGLLMSSSWVPAVLTAYLDSLQSSYASGGIFSVLASVPAITLTAIHDVPSLTFNLNSVAWAISVALLMIITPVAFVTGLQCCWAVAAGPARKTLSTLFLFLLWPIFPVVGAVGLAALWAVLGLFVMVFIVVGPLVAVSTFTWQFVGGAHEWRVEQQRLAHNQPVEDITFLELAIALVVAPLSACTTAPLVACLAIVKSPVVFLCTVSSTAYNLTLGDGALFRNWGWFSVFIPPLFLVVLAGLILLVALGTLASILIKVAAAVLWPSYVACGMLRSVGARRQQRSLETILWHSLLAAYQVVWFSDIITNAAILMRPSLASKASDEIMKLAMGARQELSADVKRVSCLPSVIIGVVAQDERAGWRLNAQALARSLNLDVDVVQGGWDSFFAEMAKLGKTYLDRELLTTEYVEESPPALLIGLPALVILEACKRSPKGLHALKLANGLTVGDGGLPRPTRTGFAREAWEALMNAKRAHEAATDQNALPAQSEMLEAVLLAGGAPLDELPPMLRAAISSSVGEDGHLPPSLAAVQKPLYALAYKMAGQITFKNSFMSLVYNQLSEYKPSVRMSARGYTPPAAPRVGHRQAGQAELM